MSFQNQTIWITGASSGIGEALSLCLARRGARLILSARREKRLAKVKKRCRGAKNVQLVPLDLADTQSVIQKAREVEQRVGAIDILINNAGISQRALAKDTTLAVDRQIMEVNFFGPVALTKALLPVMIARRAGHIVVVSSLAGKLGTPLRSAYCASKHALHGFFDSLRAEVHKAHLYVTLVCPGFVRTDISLYARQGDGSAHGRIDSAIAQGISPEACAKRILKAIERKEEEVVIGGKEVASVYLKRWTPRLLSKLIRRLPVT